jgi:tripartite-type tricarboxylate transporter receptor subunit TctC
MPSFLTRRLFAGALFSGTSVASLAASTSAPASAQSYPSRPIRYIVPFAAGAGILDIMSRLVGQHLGPILGQQIVIDNRPGGGGLVGVEIAAKSAPDGYTMVMGSLAMAVAPYLYSKLSFDPMSDLIPVTQVNSAPLMLVVHPDVPVKTAQEFIAYAKSKPGQLTFGSGGVGSTPFFAVELLKSLTGMDAVHVPYKGGAPALADLVGGQLTFTIENVPGTMPLVKGGKLRALAITSAKRSPLVPELPTMAEAGAPGYEMVGWNGIFVPKGVPPEILARLSEALIKALRSPEVKEQMAAQGAEPVGSTPAEFASFFRGESTRWGALIKEKGIKPE